MPSNKLPDSFFRQPDVVHIARELLGKTLCTHLHGAPLTSGVIVETEAYCGRGDKACHANNNTRTQRTETMYQDGGVAYIYLCYGIHHLINVVTNVEDKADAVLIRAIQPKDGISVMKQRRDKESAGKLLTGGPGRLTQALGITTTYDGTNLQGDQIWIEDRGVTYDNKEIEVTPRIGVDYAEGDADLPWRFFPRGNPWVSK